MRFLSMRSSTWRASPLIALTIVAPAAEPAALFPFVLSATGTAPLEDHPEGLHDVPLLDVGQREHLLERDADVREVLHDVGGLLALVELAAPAREEGAELAAALHQRELDLL